jgi:MFS transporter, DHA3 family, multidrug efflux protein
MVLATATCVVCFGVATTLFVLVDAGTAASPLTTFLIGPLAETVFMPFMTDGSGVDWIGGWFGTGPERGIALLFTLAGLIGVTVTLLARASRSYRRLAAVA